MKVRLSILCLLQPLLWCAASAIAEAAPQSSGSMLIDPAGTVYLVNPESGFVSAIDSRTDRVIRESSVGVDSRCLALSPDGRYLYVTNEASGVLAVLDAGTLRRRQTIRVDAGPYGIAADPGRELLYVASSAFSVIDVV